MNRVFFTVDAFVLSVAFLGISIFYLEGSPGPFTTKLATFSTELYYSLFGPDTCDAFVCYSNLRNTPNPKSKSKPITLGAFKNFTGCEAACIKYKVVDRHFN